MVFVNLRGAELKAEVELKQMYLCTTGCHITTPPLAKNI